MKIVEQPQVFMIGQPAVDRDEMRRYLSQIEDDEGHTGEEWVERLERTGIWDSLPDAALLVEFMGRLCYKSWVPGLNKNVVKVREDHEDYIANILSSGHGSVIEHAHFNFVFHNVSRVFSAEMNRHRLANISEQSLRYVRLDDIAFWEPDGLKQETYEQGRDLLTAIEDFISGAYLREFTEGMSFAEKKAITSKLRRWAPLGLATEEGWTANIRNLRHVIAARSSFGAEEEIRIVADQIANLCAAKIPMFFSDFTRDLPDDGGPAAWVPSNVVAGVTRPR